MPPAGTFFKMTPGGTLTTLYSFNFMNEGLPYGPMAQGHDGNFYGTSGFNFGLGVIFRITPAGKLTILHSFDGTDGDDRYYPSGLILGSDGNVYGATASGGPNYSQSNGGDGTIFEITPGGTFTTLYAFCAADVSCANGGPEALLQDTNGTFYGFAAGGAYGSGEIFSLSVGLAPFVKTEPAVGVAGEIIKILGTDLTGATSVTFNGTPAVFSVIAPSLMLAQVPTGAKSGKIQVVTPGGTLLSNVSFGVF